MKRKYSRLISLLLVLSMMIGVMQGCQTANDNSATTGSNENPTVPAGVIDEATVFLDNTSYKYDKGSLTVNIKTSGYKLSSDLSAKDVFVEDTTVSSAAVKGDGIIELSMKTDADSIESAIDKINKKKLTIKASALGVNEDVSLTILSSQVAFYFSGYTFKLKDETALQLLLELTPINGSFADGFGKGNITLSGDVADASLDSVTVKDGVATVSLLVPASVAAQNTTDIGVFVELCENSLVNQWGTKLNDFSYFGQNIPLLTNADKATLQYKSVRDFCNYVGSSPITKALGPFGSIVSLAAGAVTTSYDLSKAFGFLGDEGPSDFEVINQRFDEISDHLSAQDAKLKEILEQLDRMQVNELREQISQFTCKMTALESYTKSVSCYIEKAADNLMSDVTVPSTSLEGISERLLSNRSEGKTDKELYNSLSADEKAILEEWNDYYDTLFDRLETEAGKSQRRGNYYKGYGKAVDNLEQQFTVVCNELNAGKNSIFDKYDQLCRNTYLFDATALIARDLYRASARATIDGAMTMLIQVYGGLHIDELDDNATLYDYYENYYIPAVNVITSSTTSLDYTDPSLKDIVNFYPSENPGNHVKFSLLQYDYDSSKVKDAASRSAIEEKARTYYDNMRKCLFWSNLTDKERAEVRNRLDGLGYVYKNSHSELMVYEANIIANILGYPVEGGNYPTQYNYYYLASFDSFELSWVDNKLTVTLKNCVMYDMMTGELKEQKSYTYHNGADGTDGLYALYFSSSKNK